jgi:electron transfer flavoprotein beta subunit
MKILVTVKRVPDYATKIKIKPDGLGIETDGIKWIINPFDEIAVEEAIRLKEAGTASEVVVLCIGPDDTQTQIRQALAMGADSGILVKTDDYIDSDAAARIIKKIIQDTGDFKLVIMGKQAVDSDRNQTPQLLASYLNYPQATFASKVVIEGEKALVTREIDGGLETVKIPLPCVISTDLRLNEPRYASLPGIMKAKKKELKIVDLGTLGVDATPKIKIKKLSLPPKRQAGRKIQDYDELYTLIESKLN